MSCLLIDNEGTTLAIKLILFFLSSYPPHLDAELCVWVFCTGANNKSYFADAMKAQTVCKLLGVSMEDLYKYVFTSATSSASKSNMRFVLL